MKRRFVTSFNLLRLQKSSVEDRILHLHLHLQLSILLVSYLKLNLCYHQQT